MIKKNKKKFVFGYLIVTVYLDLRNGLLTIMGLNLDSFASRSIQKVSYCFGKKLIIYSYGLDFSSDSVRIPTLLALWVIDD